MDSNAFPYKISVAYQTVSDHYFPLQEFLLTFIISFFYTANMVLLLSLLRVNDPHYSFNIYLFFIELLFQYTMSTGANAGNFFFFGR